MNLECRNTKGQLVQNGIEFVPKGADPCRLCICENDLAKVSNKNNKASQFDK